MSKNNVRQNILVIIYNSLFLRVKEGAYTHCIMNPVHVT